MSDGNARPSCNGREERRTGQLHNRLGSVSPPCSETDIGSAGSHVGIVPGSDITLDSISSSA
jgi:hypothetical protein